MFAIIVAVMASSPAAAQVAPGQFAPRALLTTQTERSAEMGRCVLGRNRKLSIGLVRADLDGPEYRRIGERLYPDMVMCLKGSGSATLNAISLRGTIGESLVKERDGEVLTLAAAASPVAPVRAAGTGEGLRQAIIGCAVAATPTAAVGMLRAYPGTPEEAAAFRLLVPALQACVPLTGEVRIKPFEVRPLAAIALYQRFGGTAS